MYAVVSWAVKDTTRCSFSPAAQPILVLQGEWYLAVAAVQQNFTVSPDNL